MLYSKFPMKNSLLSVVVLLFISSFDSHAQTNTAHKIITPFQGTKIFCSFTGKSKYTVTVQGSKAIMVYSYKEYTTRVSGNFKNGKLYTNDPYEKQSKAGGRYYLISKEMVRVLNLENGDYEEYNICK
jgi:hypothetical protein